MIYVTHDQTEALTFADRVVVMTEGEVVQTGTPAELFERPQHTFVGHFIGSPGMNVLPAEVTGRAAWVGGERIALARHYTPSGERIEIGVRPEFVTLGREGVAVGIDRVEDAGRYRIVRARLAGHRLDILAPEGGEIPAEPRALLAPGAVNVYADGWIVEASE
jgi:glycerol transport system ATP-binding protein